MERAGREPDWSRVAAAGRLLVEAFDPPTPTPVGLFVTPAAAAAPPPSPTRTASPSPVELTRTRVPPTATPRPPPTPTAPPTATAGPVEYVLTRQELDAELTRAIAAGGVPLRNPTIRLVPSDRVALTGQLPVAIFLVPVELEARLTIDERGR